MQLQKSSVQPLRSVGEKDVKSKVVACDDRLMAKLLMSTILVNLVLNLSATYGTAQM